MAAFAPEVIAHLGSLPITNTLLHTFIVDGILIATAVYLSKRITIIPKGLQTVVEPIIEMIYSLVQDIAPSKKAAKAIFPFIMTFFLFILVANFTGLLPGVGTIGFFTAKSNIERKHSSAIDKTYASTDKVSLNKTNSEVKEHTNHSDEKFIPLLRGATSDINVTLALAVISVLSTHILSIKVTGIKDYLGRWFSLNPVNLYVGLLELVAELTKVLSLSFRLFGNVYAGEVALHTISALFAFLAPLPFLLLESIVSVVQALVFSILTLVFMSVLTNPHHAHEGIHEIEH